MANEVVAAQAAPVSTTFGDLFFSGFTDPWSLVMIAVVSAMLGMVTHWFKATYKKQTHLTMYQWFIEDNLWRLFWSVAGTLGALFTLFAPLDYTTITVYQVISQAWAVGFASDSIINTSAYSEGDTDPKTPS